MDPRFKLDYYIDNEFESNYIQTYKQQIKKLWNNEYIQNSNESDNQSSSNSNALMAHIFKKRKLVKSDELDTYLNNASILNANVLMFWKVNFKVIYYYYLII